MPIVDSFTAYDKEMNGYEINVFETLYSSLASGRASIKDYSIAATGEVLKVVQTEPLVFRIKSTDTLIAYIRGQ